MVTSQTYMPNIVTARIKEVVERPRPFVTIGRYFGPDRRRKANVLDENADRRSHGAILLEGNPLRV